MIISESGECLCIAMTLTEQRCHSSIDYDKIPYLEELPKRFCGHCITEKEKKRGGKNINKCVLEITVVH